jgi:hypothetical protein
MSISTADSSSHGVFRYVSSGISATASGGGYAFALPYTMPAVETHSSDAAVQMAKKLKNAGAKMYGAFWCSHCFQQKEYFGQEAMADFPYVECYPEGFFRSEDGKGTVIDKVPPLHCCWHWQCCIARTIHSCYQWDGKPR